MAKKSPAAAFKSAVHKDKFKHGTAAVVFTAVFIAVVIVINILVSVLTTRFPSLNIDLTQEKLNTLSEDSLEVARGVQQDTTLYLIGSEEAYRGDQLFTNYNLKYSQVANLADRLQEANSKIHVEFVDPDVNPQFISQYSDENLYSGTVVVQTEKRHRVLDVNDLFGYTVDSTTNQQQFFSQVDGALANALYLVNLDTVPVVAIATGHGEMLSVGENLDSFVGLLEDNSFEVKQFDILLEDIPEDADIIFFGVPTTDFTSEEIAKLDAFITDSNMDASRSLLFAAYPTEDWKNTMPNLSTFLEEWGLAPQTAMVVETDQNNIVASYTSDPSYIFTTLNTDEQDTLMEGSYPNMLMPASAPIERLFTANSDIVTYSVVESASTSYVLTNEVLENGELPENPETSAQTVVAVAQRYMDNYGNVRASVAVLGSAQSLLASYLGNSTFGNRAFMTDFVKTLSGTTDLRVGLTINQTPTNTLDISASASFIYIVGFVVFTVLVPVAVLAVGLVIFLRRRHL